MAALSTVPVPTREESMYAIKSQYLRLLQVSRTYLARTCLACYFVKTINESENNYFTHSVRNEAVGGGVERVLT